MSFLSRGENVRSRPRVVLVAALLFGLPSTGAAQSASQLGAWDALMLSPFGALPPRVADSDVADRPKTEVLLRYGRWKYDIDDAAHNNFGLTLARELPFWSTEVALTGAYLSLQCGGCSNWMIAGLDVESTLWRQTFAPLARGTVNATVGVRASVGGARNSGQETSHASSIALAVPIGLGVATGRHSYLDVAILPGVGTGEIAGADRAEGGTLPSLGAAVAWRLDSGLGIELGVEKIFIGGGPSQLGVGLSWGLGGRGRDPH
ncbi:MAG: hypothetical protein JWM41_2229 [Gemmatimonadetes bacterium]|nr:hypothetical protein [Gemmatimonadota bacterium]